MRADAGFCTCVWSADADFTALTGTTSEGNLLAAGGNWPPILPPPTFDKDAKGKRFKFVAKGVLGADAARTFTFFLTLQTSTTWATIASATTATQILASAAITSAAVSNKWWQLEADIVCRTPGAGANMTLQADGHVTSPTGFVSPFLYPLEATTPDTGTWTTGGLNGATTYYLGLSATPNNANCTITVKDGYLLRFN